MFKKRLKGLLAMLLAGSIAATALPLTASATISAPDVSVCDGNRNTSNHVSCYDLQDDDWVYPYLTPDNLWGVYYSYSYTDSGCTPPEEKYATGTEAFSGDKLLEKIEGFEDDYRNFYSDIRITAKHWYIVTTEDPSKTNISATSAQTTSTFPVEIPLTDYDFSEDPLMEYSCTPWYSVANFSGDIFSECAVKSTDEPVRFSAGDESIFIGMDTFKGLYSAAINTGNQNHAIENFFNGITILQLKSEYKTLSLPVYDGLGKLTTDKVSVTDGDTGDLIPDGKTEALNGSYVLVYDKDSSTQKVSAAFKNKADLWNAIEAVANEHSEFDVSKAKLVRYVNYGMYYDVIGYFTSVDLLNEVADNPDINYLNERKTSGSIWKISCCEISPTGLYTYPNKLVSGDSFDAEIKAFLNEHNCDAVDLSNKTKLLITATDPSTQAGQDGEIEFYGQVITINTDKQYPVKVSDLAAKLTAEISPTAGMTYNKDEWELWPCYTASGRITIKSKATVDDPAADIGITHYELALKQKRDNLLVYFPQVKIAPSLEVTAPVAGETPSFEYKIVDNVGGYSVVSVEWSCGNTLLGPNDKFKAGKEYTVRFELSADVNLLFVDSTPVTINGEKAETSYDENIGFYASRSFTTAPEKPSPEKPSNVKATAGDSNITLTWNAVKGAAKYKVMYRLSGTTEWAEQETNDTSYNVTGLTNGKAYEFIVLAGNANGWSKWTDKDIVTATPNEYKGAVLKYGDVYEEVGTVAAAFTRITKLNKPENEYIITVDTDLTEKALNFPKAAKSISLITTDNAVITFSGTSISTATDVIFNCDIIPQSAGKAIAVKAAAGKALTFEKSLANLVTVSGTATSVLNVGCDMTAASVSSFKEVNIKDDCTLTVTGNVSGVAKLGGTLKLLNPKATAAITDVENAVFELTSGADTKGNFIMPKVTVKDVLEKLEITVVDEKGDEVKLKNKATVLYLSTAADATGEITVTNINTADEKLTAFRYNKEIKACYADQISLYINDVEDRNYPDLELVFAKIKANEAELGKVKESADYKIVLNADTDGTKLVLPAKAKSITINGNGHKLSLTGVTALSPKYDFTLENVNIVNEKNLTINAGGSLTLKVVASTMPLDIKGAKNKKVTLDNVDNINALSGTNTTELVANSDISAVNVSSFKSVATGDNILSVSGKVSAVTTFDGGLKLTNTKATAAVTSMKGSLIITKGTDKDGNDIISKATLTSIPEGEIVAVKVVDAENNKIGLMSGTTVLYNGGKNNIASQVSIINTDETGRPLGAFAYSKEIRACNVSLVTMNEVDYPDLEKALADINSAETDYEITLNTNANGGKFALPSNAKSLTIKGGDHNLILKNISALSPKYSLTLENIKVINNKAITINVPKGCELVLKNVTFTSPVNIKGAAGSTITLENVIGTGTLSGTNTTILNIDSNLESGAVSTFGELNIASEKKLTVNGNISGVVKARGKLSETSPKATINITGANGLVLEAVRTVDTNGKPVFAKATITEVTENGLTMGIVDENGDLIALPSGTAVVTCNKADNITIANSDLTGNALTAHLHGKEVRACFTLVTLYDGEEKVDDYCDFETAVKNINDNGKVKTKNYRLVLNSDAVVDTLTLPNTAKSIELDGNGNSIRFIKLTSLAAKTDFTLKNVTIDAVKPITITASQNLNIENVESEKITAIKGSAKFALTVNGCDMVDSVSGFKTVNLNSSFGARNSFAVAANLAIGENGELMVPAGAKVQLKDVSGAEGAKLNLAAGISPIKITGTATGKIAITGTVTDGTQLFTTNTADLGIFDTSEITPDDGLEYDLNNISGKVYFRGKKLKIGEKTFALWDDMVTYIRNQKNADADYVIEILGDYNVGGALKLPAKGTYKSIEIKSDNEEIKRSISFTGTSVAATGKLTLKDIELVSLNTKGTKVKYTVNAGANELVLENCNPEMAAISATGTVTLKNTAIGGTVKAGTLNLSGYITFNDTVTAGAINCLGDTNVDILMKKYLNVSTKKGIVTNDNTLTIRIVGADKDAVKPLPLDKTGAYVLSSAFKGTVTDGIKISEENGSYKLEIKNGKLLVKAAE